MRPLGRQAEEHPTSTQAEASARLSGRQLCLALQGTNAKRHDVDAGWLHVQQIDKVVARALRIGDHAIRAAGGRRYEQLHALPADAWVRVG